MIVPAYGLHWRHTIAKMSPFLWHIRAMHSDHPFRSIRVAPWNRRRRPTRKGKS